MVKLIKNSLSEEPDSRYPWLLRLDAMKFEGTIGHEQRLYIASLELNHNLMGRESPMDFCSAKIIINNWIKKSKSFFITKFSLQT